MGIGLITEYYTGTGNKPVKSVAAQSITGSATNIIAGLGVGMQSTLIPILIIAISIIGRLLEFRSSIDNKQEKKYVKLIHG